MAARSLYPFEWLGKSRASLPKVKTGCVSCKKRHVKCDEAKPVCKRCKTGNRPCLYQPQQRLVSEDACLQVQLRYSRTRSPPTKRQFSSEAERCGFDKFRHTVGAVLGDAIGWHDWGDIVLQNSENDPALRHAVIALSAMHEEALRTLGEAASTKDPQLLSLAYKQYHGAIKHLRSQLQHQPTRSVEANMLACMLLVAFDFMQGDYRAAAVHLSGGVTMLRSYLKQYSSIEALVMRISAPWRTSLDRSGVPPTEGSFGARLLLSYGYIDFWGFSWMDGLLVLPEVLVLEGLEVKRSPRPANELNTSFQTFSPLEKRIQEFLRAARGLFYQHGQQFPRNNSRRELPHQTSQVTFDQMKTTLTSLLNDWYKNYKCVCSTYACNEPWEIQAINCLAVNHKNIELMLAAAQSDGRVDYRACTPAFKEVLALSRKVFDGNLFPAISPYHDNSPFSFTIGIIYPLYITALNCADASVSHEAVDLLTSKHWKEGAWDSLVMARIAREQLEGSLDGPGHVVR